MRIRSALIAVTLGLCAACGEEPPQVVCDPLPAPADGKPTATLGLHTDGGFVEVVADQQLDLVQGGQGGVHFDIAVRAYANDGGVWLHALDMFGETDRSHQARGRAQSQACAPGWTTTGTFRVFVRTATMTRGLLEAVSTIDSDPTEVRTELPLRFAPAM